jgi:hypothetical protein
MPTQARLPLFMRFLIVISLSLASTRALALCEALFDPFTVDPIKRAINRGGAGIGHTGFHFCDEAQGAFQLGKISGDVVSRITEGSSDNYMGAMDYGVTLPKNGESLAKFLRGDETKMPYVPGISSTESINRLARGRNNWIVWTAGNDRFWTFLFKTTIGGLDFLKTVSDYPNYPKPPFKPITRDNRWKEIGLVNEPCFAKATGPRADRFGLWLPKRVGGPGCPTVKGGMADPFEDENMYPGVKAGSRGQCLKWDNPVLKRKCLVSMPVGSFYGYASGVIGLRLFPNPDFTAADLAKWDPKRFYEDPAYFYDPNIKRPYRVGMSCGFCHVGPNPSRPPRDFSNPGWENLSSNPGAQYWWVDRIFDWDYQQNQDNFVVQLLKTSRPGTVDTSLVSSDMINNPRTMNAVYDLPARVMAAVKFNHLEELRTKDEQANKQFSTLSDAKRFSPLLNSIYNTSTNQVLSPRVLKDGSDSVGALGALNRVYINIGLYGEEWIQNFIPIVGGPLITPVRIPTAEDNSVMWRATESQTPDLALFFLASTRKDALEDAKDSAGNNIGKQYLKDWNSPEVKDGRRIFARNCAACHSSKLPEDAYGFFNKKGDPTACVGSKYLDCWNDYWAYVKTSKFKDDMVAMVEAEEAQEPQGFLKNNYLSTELRVPVNLVDSGYCSSVATNALKGDIWDNFASSSYKELPSVGRFTVDYPTMNSHLTLTAAEPADMTEEELTVPPTSDDPRGGRGFFRPASLISVWSTAPFLQNNTLGRFHWEGTVDARMKSFEDSIDKLLNPKKRGEVIWPTEKSVMYTNSFGKKLPGVIDVTTQDSYLKIPKGFIPTKLLWTWIKNAVDREEQQTPGIFQKLLFGMYASPVKYEEIPERLASNAQEPPKPKKRGFWSRLFGGSESTDLSSFGDWGPGDSDEKGEFIKLGPIPKGTPVNLLSNINLDLVLKHPDKIQNAVTELIRAIAEIKRGNLKGQAALDTFMRIAAQPLLDVSRCKDFVVNRGHYFGTEFSPDTSENPNGLTVDEKEHLIEFLKYL